MPVHVCPSVSVENSNRSLQYKMYVYMHNEPINDTSYMGAKVGMWQRDRRCVFVSAWERCRDARTCAHTPLNPALVHTHTHTHRERTIEIVNASAHADQRASARSLARLPVDFSKLRKAHTAWHFVRFGFGLVWFDFALLWLIALSSV